VFSPFLFGVRVWEVVRLLRDDGWYVVAQRGSHMQFKHPIKGGRVTIAGNPSQSLASGTLNSVFKQAKINKKGEDFA
jgi:predicted RNA binding protein YcfA (HicA-like mRNA interferase family)